MPVLSSVRVRLTLWYTAILGLVLVVFATGVYLAVSHRLYRELDRGLDSALNVAAVSLQHEIEEHKGQHDGETNFGGVLATIHHTSFPRQAISVFTGGTLVAYKAGAGPKIVTEPKGDQQFQTHEGQRFAVHRVFIPAASREYRFVAAEPVANVENDLADVRGILFLAVPFALVLAAGFGYVLARKSLAPVVAMSEQVNRITAGNLNERLSVGNSQDELSTLASTFNQLLGRLHQAFDHQRRFMADASHELRTPIAVTRTAAQVTLDGAERNVEEYREALGIVAAQMQRLTRVVNDMFTLARADSGVYTLHRRRFYCNDVLLEAVQAARLLALGKNIAIECGEMEESPYDGDEDLIRQLLLILLDNAVKYTPEGGRVSVSLHSGYVIEVQDSGMGIPEEARTRIFERFYRLDKARSRSNANATGGAGLGLSIARWIAGVHHGKVELAWSRVAEGSLFRVILPAGPTESSPAKIENGATV